MKKTRIHQMAVSFLVTLSLIASFGTAALAGEVVLEEDAPVYLLDEETEIPDGSAFDFTNEESRIELLEEAESFPASFDMRDEGWITPVKLQNPYGSCWAFSAIAAAESSIISSGFADNTLNLSEKHLAYFSRSSISAANANAKHPQLSSQYGEGYNDKEMDAPEKMNVGGYSILSSNVFETGVGVVSEFDAAGEKIDDFYYSGKNSSIATRVFGGGSQPFSYHKDGDWSISAGTRYQQDYALAESYLLPTPAHIENLEYSYDEAAVAAIKKQILAGRAVDIGFLADQASPDQEEVTPLFLSNDWAHYGPHANIANHAVTLIGWDDTIGLDGSPAKFINGKEPKDAKGNILPGAFLVKNSWGSGEEEFPNKGTGTWGIRNEDGIGTGYFWLSYHDQSLSFPEAFRMEPADDLLVDAYDYMPAQELIAKEFDDEVIMCNIFTATQRQKLKKISFQTTHPDTQVHYEVYLVNPGTPDPTGTGYKAAEGDIHCEFGGFHKIDLEKEVSIMKGQGYAILITETIKDKNGKTKYTVNIPVGSVEEMTGIMNVGESFFGVRQQDDLLPYSWRDLDTSLDDIIKSESPDDPIKDREEYAVDNWSIKGYSEPLDGTFAIVSVNGNSSLIYALKDSTNLTVRTTYKTLSDKPENLRFEWENKNQDLVSFETQNSEGSSIKVSVKHPEGPGYPEGNAMLIVHAYDGEELLGSFAASVSVSRAVMETAEIIDESNPGKVYEYTGKEIRPEVRITDFNAKELQKGRDYSLTYSDNIKCGAATITANPEGASKPGFHASTFFAIKPTAAELLKVTAGEEKLTAEVTDQKASGITGYAVQYRVKGTDKWETKKIKAGSPLTVTGLTAGKQYEVRVRAYVDIEDPDQYYGMIEPVYYGGFSSVLASDTIAEAPTEEPTEPAVTEPSKAVVSEAKAGAVKVVVTVKDQSAEEIAGYQIQYRVKGTSKWKTKTLAAGKTKISLKKLKAGKKYEVRARAYKTADGKDLYGPYSSVKTSKLVTPAKAAVKALNPEKAKLGVRVKNQKSTGITGYQIKYRAKGTSKWKTKTLKASKSRLLLKKMKSGKKYQVKVRGFVKVGSKKYYGKFSKVKTSDKVK